MTACADRSTSVDSPAWILAAQAATDNPIIRVESVPPLRRPVTPNHREFIRSMPSTELHAAHPELLHLVAEAIGATVASGELPDRVRTDLAASLALLQMIAPMTYMMSGQEADFDEFSSLLLDQWLAGMAHVVVDGLRRW
jgi:hypothetical protein